MEINGHSQCLWENGQRMKSAAMKKKKKKMWKNEGTET